MSKRLTQSERCAKHVFGDYVSHQCTRRGVVEEDGAVWCRQHVPSAVKARREEASRKYQEEYDHKVRLRTTETEVMRAALATTHLDDLERLLKATTAYREARK